MDPVQKTQTTSVTPTSSTYTPRFHYIWTSGGRPAAVFATATPGPTLTSTATTTTFRLRTRKDTTPPRVEFCDGTYPTVATNSNNCTSTSPRNSWAQISLPNGTASTTLTIGDDFRDGNYIGFASNLPCTASATTQCDVNRWPDIWVESDTTQSSTAGRVTISGTAAPPNNTRALRLSGASTTTNTWASRVVNLHALQSPRLSFTQRVTGLSGTNPTLHVSYTTSNALPSTDTGWTVLGTTTASGVLTATAPATGSCTSSAGTWTCRILLPPAAQTGFTKIRFRANSNFTASQSVDIDNIGITNFDTITSTDVAVSINNWCEYSSTSPATQQFTGGFHCLGPLLNMANGGRFIVDTSGGNLSFYYNSASDTRGQSFGSPLINMAAGAELLHVNCPNSGSLTQPPSPTTGAAVTPTDNCNTGIPNTIYAAVGEKDLLNIFGAS